MPLPRRVLFNFSIISTVVLLTLTAYNTVIHYALHDKLWEQEMRLQWKQALEKQCSMRLISVCAAWPNLTISKPALPGTGPFFCGPLDRCSPADPPVIWIG